MTEGPDGDEKPVKKVIVEIYRESPGVHRVTVASGDDRIRYVDPKRTNIMLRLTAGAVKVLEYGIPDDPREPSMSDGEWRAYVLRRYRRVAFPSGERTHLLDYRVDAAEDGVLCGHATNVTLRDGVPGMAECVRCAEVAIRLEIMGKDKAVLAWRIQELEGEIRYLRESIRSYQMVRQQDQMPPYYRP